VSKIMTITYQPQAEDSSIESDRYRFKLLATRSNEQRMLMTAKLTKGGRKLSLMGLESTFGYLSQPDFALKVAQVWLGNRWPIGFTPQGDAMTWIQDSLELAEQLHPIFATLNIQYYVTGGVAATTYGEPRLTIDLDLVINVSGAELYPLIVALEAENFYVPGVEDAVSGRMNTLQITHQQTIATADIAIATDEVWEKIKFHRRRLIAGIYLASPEDVILNKLKWGKQSQSEKQWRDVLGIFKVQGTKLDFAYLQQWGHQLGLSAELNQAIEAAGLAGLGDSQTL
jgi:hypothetical protein